MKLLILSFDKIPPIMNCSNIVVILLQILNEGNEKEVDGTESFCVMPL